MNVHPVSKMGSRGILSEEWGVVIVVTCLALSAEQAVGQEMPQPPSTPSGACQSRRQVPAPVPGVEVWKTQEVEKRQRHMPLTPIDHTTAR